MGRVESQFYALREELIPLIESWKEQFSFRMVVVQYFLDNGAFEVNSFQDVEALPILLDNINEVLLGYDEPAVAEKNRYQFILRHSNFLIIQPGKLSSDGLEESSIGGITEDAELLRIWRKVTGQLKKVTKAGLWAVNSEFGGKHFYRNTRYTSGAEKLSKSGVKLLTDGSFVVCSVEEPTIE